MSKTGNWVLAMQEDAFEMTLAEFVAKWGLEQRQIWDDVQLEMHAG